MLDVERRQNLCKYFMPYSDYAKVAQVLDRLRLGKQREGGDEMINAMLMVTCAVLGLFYLLGAISDTRCPNCDRAVGFAGRLVTLLASCALLASAAGIYKGVFDV